MSRIGGFIGYFSIIVIALAFEFHNTYARQNDRAKNLLSLFITFAEPKLRLCQCAEPHLVQRSSYFGNRFLVGKFNPAEIQSVYFHNS